MLFHQEKIFTTGLSCGDKKISCDKEENILKREEQQKRQVRNDRYINKCGKKSTEEEEEGGKNNKRAALTWFD